MLIHNKTVFFPHFCHFWTFFEPPIIFCLKTYEIMFIDLKSTNYVVLHFDIGGEFVIIGDLKKIEFPAVAKIAHAVPTVWSFYGSFVVHF